MNWGSTAEDAARPMLDGDAAVLPTSSLVASAPA
jgi:hypothetical protein